MKYRSSVSTLLLIVPIHNYGLVGSVHLVIVDILGNIHCSRGQLALELRVRTNKKVIVLEFYMEDIAGLLDILDTRLPKEIDNVNLPYADIPKTIEFALIPKDTVYTRTRF